MSSMRGPSGEHRGSFGGPCVSRNISEIWGIFWGLYDFVCEKVVNDSDDITYYRFIYVHINMYGLCIIESPVKSS